MESGKPESPVMQTSKDEEMKALIEQVNMKFQLLEVNMNLIVSQSSGNFTRIFSQLNQLETLFDRVGKLEETSKEKEQTSKTGTEEQENVQENPKKDLTQQITPLSEIIKRQTQEKEKEVDQSSTASTSKAPANSQKSKETSTSNPIFKLGEIFKYFKTKLIFNLNHLSFKEPRIKYISHYAFNKAVIHQGTPSNIVKALWQYGLIQTIYPSTNLEELNDLPKDIQQAVKTYFGIVTQYQVFIRCYSTIAEVTPDKYYHPINLIKMGTTRKPFEHAREPKDDIENNEDFMDTVSRVRAQDYNIIFQEMNRIITDDNEAPWVYYYGTNILIYSAGRSTRNLNQFNQFYDKIKGNKFENTPRTKKRICQLLSDYAVHKCPYCEGKSPERDEDEEPIIDASII